MKAELILHTKEARLNETVEIKIWRVPVAPKTPDGVKVSLVYIKSGVRVLGYDNAEGKGYHRHRHGKEEPYSFSSIRQLMDDFKADLVKIRRRSWDED